MLFLHSCRSFYLIKILCLLGYRARWARMCTQGIRSISGYNRFIATCSVCLWCYTCFPKLANQDVWLRQTCYKVKSLLSTPNSVTTSPYPWEVNVAHGSPLRTLASWQPEPASAVYFGNWQIETQRWWSALFQKFWNKDEYTQRSTTYGRISGSILCHVFLLVRRYHNVFTNQRFCG